MNESLRPSNLGEILDRTLAFYRARFLVFFGIAVLPAGVVLAFASALFLFFAWLGSGAAGTVQPRTAQVLAWLILAGIMLLALPVCVAVSALGTSALNHGAASAYRDEEIAILAAYKDAWGTGGDTSGSMSSRGSSPWLRRWWCLAEYCWLRPSPQRCGCSPPTRCWALWRLAAAWVSAPGFC